MRPDRPLNFKPLDIELDTLIQIDAFLRDDAQRTNPQSIGKFLDLVASASDWTRAELGRLTARELQQVFAEIQQSGSEEDDGQSPLPPPSSSS